MTDAEKLLKVRTLGEFDDTDSVLTSYLAMAKEAILSRLYPFDADAIQRDMPAKYDYKQVQIAIFLLGKRGAEGQIIHAENGINRHWSGANIPPGMMDDIVPFCGVV